MGIQRGGQIVQATSSSTTDALIQQFGQLHVLDDLIRLRAADMVQHPILAYPCSNTDTATATYEYYTGRDMDNMIDKAVTCLMNDGFQPPKGNGSIVAVLAPSDISMVITFFALSRLGYTVMMLSPRLCGDACVALLDTVGCETIIYGNTLSIRATIGDILQKKLVSCRPMLSKSNLDTEETLVLILHRNRNSEAQCNRIALILHSSGSTGTPKPLFLSHRALMTHPLRGPGLTSFNSLPWYHLHGLSTALQAMWMKKTAYLWNAALPLTAESVVAALEAARPESVAAVPYMLQLLVDSPRGISALRKCHLVTYGGAPCPDELGDCLVSQGVQFGGSFGLTEAGLVAESISRPKGDIAWNYLNFFDNIRPYIWMKPLGMSLYECVYLAGHPALTTSNSNEPPGSFHSRDVFTPHPTIPHRWKYVSRLDDCITLVTGEKILPLPIEGYVKQHPLIYEAIVVGVGKAIPGLLILRADQSTHLSEREYIDTIWSVVEEANARSEQFSQISRDMIATLPSTSEFPRTDKGSMIRAQIYSQYNDLINGMYTEVQSAADGGMTLDLTGTQSYLMELCSKDLGIHLTGVDANFFLEGVDSLKAIHLRRLILRHFNIASAKSLGQNVVFEAGSVSGLATYICALQIGGSVTSKKTTTVMAELISKYSAFRKHLPRRAITSSGKSVVGFYIYMLLLTCTNISKVLTGATGSIGAHTLFELLKDDSVSTIFCLTRRSLPQEAVLQALAEKNLDALPEQKEKIISLTCSLDEPNLGLHEHIMSRMQDSVSQIIHTAWPVNFNLPLTQFEPHIRGIYNLIQFSLSVRRPEPAVMIFCSSISTALGSSCAEVQEAPTQDLGSALHMGYGQSKLVGEKITSIARQSGARAFSLRIGQVSGHSKKGLWNDAEALPLMIRSALTVQALPALEQTCSWLPVDTLALTIVELANACAAPTCDYGTNMASNSATVAYVDDSIYNVSNPREFSWASLLSSLRCAGFRFDTVSFEEWLAMLRESETRGEENVNPAVKLIGHYAAMHGERRSQRLCPKRFITEKAERDSVTLRNGRLKIIEDGILNCYARDWLERWVV
ncbi:hypothetical protein N7474_003574 [Penicillium riverlandense]|uniref:uncharacterized protein n=1 Tax=Penicillium riverlandense TaxID=1903569 RepID=UPI00254990E3|nr:uncharacterized protein N7474_003574 [Penicillium riverlandense]KAJ5826436.1 hypothetical protein N7474_003574 [Penicillium riverlandense]